MKIINSTPIFARVMFIASFVLLMVAVREKPDLYILQGRIDSSFGLKRGCFYVTEEEIEDNYIILNNMFYEGD